jgi:hypothetical protein
LTKGSTTWALPIGVYTRLICATEDDYFSLLEGTGSILYSASGDYTLTCGTAPTWTDVELVADWQPKLDLAKEMIYNTLKASLATRIQSSEIDDIIADLVNPEVLTLASDYKALELIYMDLYGKIGTAESIAAKIEFYRGMHDRQMATVFPALDFGDYGYIFATSTGRITR